MPIEKADLAQGMTLPLPKDFTPLNQLAAFAEVPKVHTALTPRSQKDITVTSFAGVVRGSSDLHGYGTRRKLTFFLNCQETRNNTTGDLDFPVSMHQADFSFNLDQVEIEEGDCLLGINFGIVKETMSIDQRYSGLSKYGTRVLVLPHDKHGLQLSVQETFKLVKNYAGMKAKSLTPEQIASYVRCLKAMRGSQWLYMDDKGENQNELITIDKVKTDTKYLDSSMKSPHKASLVVEVLWAFNFTTMRDAKGNLEGCTALLEVTDYTQNPLLGETQFQTPYRCDFRNTALCIALWDNMGDPFQKRQYTEGDILQLSNVSFRRVRQQGNNSSRLIEGHIRGTAGALSENFQVVKAVGEFERAFLTRRKEYLKKNWHTSPDRWAKVYRGGVPEIILGTRGGEKLLKIENDSFYDALRNETSSSTTMKEESPVIQPIREAKRSYSSANDSSEPSSSPYASQVESTKKVRVYAPPLISSLSEYIFTITPPVN